MLYKTRDDNHISLSFWDGYFATNDHSCTNLYLDKNDILAHVEERDAAFRQVILHSTQEEALAVLRNLQNFGAQRLLHLALGQSEHNMRVKALALEVQEVLSHALEQKPVNVKNSTNKHNNAQQLPRYAKVLYSPSKGDPLAFLEKHWGDYLNYFHASKNILYQYQLRKLDPRLCNAVRNRLNYLRRKDKSIPRFQDIVPPKKEETDSILSSIPENHLEKIERVACRLSSRQQRQK